MAVRRAERRSTQLVALLLLGAGALAALDGMVGGRAAVAALVAGAPVAAAYVLDPRSTVVVGGASTVLVALASGASRGWGSPDHVVLTTAVALVAVLSTGVADRRAAQGAAVACLRQRCGRAEGERALLEAVLRATPAPTAYLDADLRFVVVNEALASWHGRPAGDHPGRSPADLLPPQDAARYLGPLRAALDLGRPVEGVELRPPGDDGTRVGQATLTPVLDEDGRSQGVVLVVVDITAEREARSRAEAARERLAQLQALLEAGVTHVHLDRLLEHLVDRIHRLVGADAVTVLLLEEDGRTLTARAAYGTEQDFSLGTAIVMGEGIAGRVAATGRPVLAAPEEAGCRDPSVRRPDLRSVAAVALAVEGRVIGVLSVGSTMEDRFDATDVNLLQVVADRVALAVDRVRLYEREREAAAALRESEQRLRALVETAADGIITLDEGGRVETVNPAAEAMFGSAGHQLVGRDLGELVPEARRGADGDWPGPLLTGRHQVDGRRGDGSSFPVELSVSEVVLGARRRYTAFVRDVTEKKEFERRLAHAALHDPLTGLANRTLLLDRLGHALERRRRGDGGAAVLFLDLDRFKVINDSMGHRAGDELLVAVAHRLRRVVRPSDTVARLGGDEFVILCEELHRPDDPVDIAGRVHAAVTAPLPLGGTEVVVSTSIGIALALGPDDSPEVLVRNADAAMYRAKERGRARFEVFDQAMQARVLRRLQVETGLRRALERDELRLHYQPLINLSTDEVTAAEALLRWEHPVEGLLAPGAFLQEAEDSGLIVPIGEVTLRLACRQAVRWQAVAGRPVGLWVNMSTRQLARPDLPGMVRDALAETGFHPRRLGLEITEGDLMEDVDVTAERLADLKSLGVHLVVDDFGTGFSSLSYLQRFPVDALKVDRSFVDGLSGADDGGSRAIASAIVRLADSLGLVAVAEGVETEEQLRGARQLGCGLAQGFLLGRPGPPEAFERMLQARPPGAGPDRTTMQ